MPLSEQAEEILEALWIQTEECNQRSLDLGPSRDEPAVEELMKLGFVKKEGSHIFLQPKGKSQAEGAIRRHRLAERLLVDVLHIKKKIIDEVSCKFEHLLHEGLEDNVCALLGHPRICPHGKNIPLGPCCKLKPQKGIFKFVSPLSELEPKEKGVVAYLYTKDPSKMQKLMSIGVLPGMPIVLLQKFPSYVFQISQSQFAIDEDLAKNVYVRLTK